MLHFLAPALLALAASTTPAALLPLVSGPITLYIDTQLGGQPQQLWHGGRQYLYHRAGGGISESGFVSLDIPPDPRTGARPSLSCSGDFFDNPLQTDWNRFGIGYVHTGCRPRVWEGDNAEQDPTYINLHYEWRTEAISHGYRMTFVMENWGKTAASFDTLGAKWALVPQLHVLRSALDPDRAWYLDQTMTWRQFPSVPTGDGWLEFRADWTYPAGGGIGVSQGPLGIALLAPSRTGMPIKRMIDPAGDGSVPDLTFFGASWPVISIPAGGRYTTRFYVLVGTLAEIAQTTRVLRDNGEIR